MMREVFKTIAGIVLLLGLVQIFNTYIKVYTPELLFITTSLNGIVFVTALMGLIIILKAAGDMIYNRHDRSTSQE
jgi:hypothetical protein